MYVNVAVLKETHPHERRVALVPSVVGKLAKLGAKLHMQSGAGDAASLVSLPTTDGTSATRRSWGCVSFRTATLTYMRRSNCCAGSWLR